MALRLASALMTVGNSMHHTTLEDLLFSYGSGAAASLELSETRGDKDWIAHAEFRGILLLLSLILSADDHGLTSEGFDMLQRLLASCEEKGFLDSDRQGVRRSTRNG